MEKFTFTVTMDGKDITRHVPFPIKWENLLDEQLDIARVTINQLSVKIITPLTPVSIDIKDSADRHQYIDMIVGTDAAQEVPVGSGKFNHEVTLIEQTKILEGIVVDALTFTNDLGRNYVANAKPITINKDTVVVDSSFNYINDTLLSQISATMSPKAKGKAFTFPSLAEIFAPYKNHPTISTSDIMYWKTEIMRVYLNGRDEHKFVHEFEPGTTNSASGHLLNEESFTVESLEVGTYEALYRVYFRTASTSTGFYTKVNFTFTVTENYDPLPRWNIASVIDRVLDLAETHLQGVEPRFKLNAEQHAEFEKIEAPEFAFTNCTLKEILDQIGGYIHGIPRLRGNTVYYDMLGGIKQATIADPQYPYVSNLFSQDIESYCSGLDSTVDNMVCLTDPEQGTIIEPYYGLGGYKTVRTETVYARITEDNMFIATQYPIQEIKSIKCGPYPSADFEGVDITLYIFEAAEYSRMSAYKKDYPNSKSYALYYTQGTKNIYGLGFKRITVNGDVLGKYSVINILEKATDKDINVDKITYPLLSFQVSYIPVFSARTQQTKQYIGDFKQPRTLVYNQGANLIETRHFGENLKGAVARMGNVDRIVTYNLGEFSLIPEIGEMFGEDYYISGVTCELYPTLIKCMLTLSQDFNRLSQYIGINSVRRFYEVSEKQAYRRDIKYADYIIIGDKVEEDTTLTDSDFLVRQISASPLSGDGRLRQQVTCVIAQGIDENGDELTPRINLPVISTAQGNATVFTFNYEDNYSAGAQVQKETEGDVSGYFTNAVAYGNYYGRLKGLKFAMKRYASSDNSLSLPATDDVIDDNPLADRGNTMISTGKTPLDVWKDGAEILSLTYILEYVTNRRGYIIGSALARKSPLISDPVITIGQYPALYILFERIGKFDGKINLNKAQKVWDFHGLNGIINATANRKYIKFDDFTPEVDGVGWAIATGRGENCELLIGSNEVITAGQTVSMPYMTLRHNIFNL